MQEALPMAEADTAEDIHSEGGPAEDAQEDQVRGHVQRDQDQAVRDPEDRAVSLVLVPLDHTVQDIRRHQGVRDIMAGLAQEAGADV